MINIKNSQRSIKVDVKKLQAYVEKILEVTDYQDFDIGILITTDATIKKFNAQYRHKNKPTDILSFSYHDIKPGKRIVASSDDDKNLGDLIISARRVAMDAKKFDEIFDDRLIFIIIHGVCHLLGYDHETDEQHKQMQTKERAIAKLIKV